MRLVLADYGRFLPAPLHPWEIFSRRGNEFTWTSLARHMDTHGYSTWMQDEYSKYPEAILLTTTAASSMINALLEVFAYFGNREQ